MTSITCSLEVCGGVLRRAVLGPVYIGTFAVEKVASSLSGLGASAPVPITRSLLQVTYEC